MVGYPALALPVAATADGRPTGLQLIGRPGADARLIALGAGIEAALAP
jgi:amidase